MEIISFKGLGQLSHKWILANHAAVRQEYRYVKMIGLPPTWLQLFAQTPVPLFAIVLISCYLQTAGRC